MNQFIGSWKLASSENFEDYMNRVGVADEMKAVIQIVKPTITISQKGDSVVFLLETVVGVQEYIFKLGDEFKKKAEDTRYCKAVMNLEGEKLIEVSTRDNGEAIIVYEIKDEKLFKTFKFQDAVAVRIFEKV